MHKSVYFHPRSTQQTTTIICATFVQHILHFRWGMQRVLWRWGRHLARTHAHTRTHLHTRGDGGTRHRIYLCCILVVAAVLAGFVNRKIDFIYTSVCVYIYILCVCVYYVCVYTLALAAAKNNFSRILHTLTRTHTHTETRTQRHWQRLTPAAAQRFDGPKKQQQEQQRTVRGPS